MRTVADALRSMRLYVSEALGDEWEVRFADDEGGFSLPFAIVDLVPVTAYDGPAMYVDITQPFAVACYPELSATATDAKLVALAVEEKLAAAFRFTGVGAGAPCRVPLYDGEDVPLTQPLDARGEHDYMRVVDFSTSRVPDPDQQWRLAVMADVRVTWRRTGRVRYGKVVESFRSRIGQTS